MTSQITIFNHQLYVVIYAVQVCQLEGKIKKNIICNNAMTHKIHMTNCLFTLSVTVNVDYIHVGFLLNLYLILCWPCPNWGIEKFYMLSKIMSTKTIGLLIYLMAVISSDFRSPVKWNQFPRFMVWNELSMSQFLSPASGIHFQF